MMYDNLDVMVIGAGLSGLTAAAKAAEQGKKVLLAAKGMGALGLSSGCIDLWGYRLDQPDQVCRHPLEEIDKLVAVNPEHPYARVRDVLDESLNFFRQVCKENNISYIDNHGGNWLLPTALGTLRPTYLAPASMAVGSLNVAEKILVVGFRELKDFYPEVLVTNLKQTGELKPGCVLKTALTSAGGGELNPNTLARRLEQPDVLDRVIGQVKPFLSPDSLVLFPPVLGERRHSDLAGKLADHLGCPVYEVANIPPTLPGQRLQQALLHHLKVLGVKVVIGCNVTGAGITGRRCMDITIAGAGRTHKISAGVFVLATGSFLGGGLEARQGEVYETIFNLPVKTTAGKWSAQEFLGMEGQPFSKFGIVVNDSLQPVDARGHVLIENLMVAGANLAGCNYPVEKCGNGVALATGYMAGKLAGEVVR